MVLRVDPGGAFGAAGDGGGGGAVLPLASRAGCCGPAAWRGAAARGAGWRDGCCPWRLLRRRFSAAADPRLVIVPAAAAWRGQRLPFAIISPGSSSSSSVLVPVPATSLRGFFCSRWRLVGGDGSIFVEFGTPDFSLLRRCVLPCRRRVCESCIGVSAASLAVLGLSMPLTRGATKVLQRARRLRIYPVISRRTRFWSMCRCRFVLFMCGVCCVVVHACTNACTNRYYICIYPDERFQKKTCVEEGQGGNTIARY